VSLRVLVLEDNNLSGPLPVELGLVRNAETIDLSDCHFEGTIPTEFGSLEGVFQLNLGKPMDRAPAIALLSMC
jgi:hypothetical protein